MEGKLNGLDLFSGGGGLTLALAPWVTPIAYCENAEYLIAQLLSRMSGGELPLAPIWDEIETLLGRELRGLVNIITAGFPCPDISVGGTGKGLAGKRSGLFFEIIRLAQEIQPEFIFLENVANIRTRGLRTVGEELARIGYDCRWSIISAKSLGANHMRKRWFCLAHLVQKGRGRQANAAEKENYQGIRKNHGWAEAATFKRDWWETEPPLDRMDNGTPFRMDRVECMGNAVVPLQARTAFEVLAGLKNPKEVWPEK